MADRCCLVDGLEEIADLSIDGQDVLVAIHGNWNPGKVLRISPSGSYGSVAIAVDDKGYPRYLNAVATDATRMVMATKGSYGTDGKIESVLK